jgi:hypothetical protein
VWESSETRSGAGALVRRASTRIRWEFALAVAMLVMGAACVWPAAAPPAILFENVIEKSGIRFAMHNSATPQRHQVETMIAGVAVLDYNNDGLLDIYCVNGAQLPAMEKTGPQYYNRLYRNNGDGTFTDVTEKAGVQGRGYSMGVAVGDYDNDGCVDIYVAGVNYNQLFHNNCDGTFTDVTARAGVAGVHPKLGKTWAISAGWFDYDNDGLLDLMVVNYVKWDLATEPPCITAGVRAYCSPPVAGGDRHGHRSSGRVRAGASAGGTVTWSARGGSGNVRDGHSGDYFVGGAGQLVGGAPGGGNRSGDGAAGGVR